MRSTFPRSLGTWRSPLLRRRRGFVWWLLSLLRGSCCLPGGLP